jgi:hypothetical protein
VKQDRSSGSVEPERSDTPGDDRQRLREPLDEGRVRRALALILDQVLRVAPDVEFRLVGPASSLLRGIRLPTANVDLLLREDTGVDLFAQSLAALPGCTCLLPPTLLPDAGQYLARFEVAGVAVELGMVEAPAGAPWPAVDTSECVGSGPWSHYDTIECGAHLVPAVKTELRLIAEASSDRPDRYKPIADYLREHGCDVDLLRRGLQQSWIPGALQREILEGIGSKAT